MRACVRAGLGAACAATGRRVPSAAACLSGAVRHTAACSRSLAPVCAAGLGRGASSVALHPPLPSRSAGLPQYGCCALLRRSSVLRSGGAVAFAQLRAVAATSIGEGGSDTKNGSEEQPSPQARDARAASSTDQGRGRNGSAKSHQDGDYPATYVKAEGRIIAIGDLHGDLTKTLQSLELAGVLGRDDSGRPVWVGGNTVVVQMGDVMDRGDCEIGIVMLLRQLHKMAEEDGGAVYMLNGNHESLNVCGDYRYVTAGAFLEAAMAAGLKDEQAEQWENQLRARVRLYSPGGPMAMELSKNPTVLVVNDTVFAHGGLLPEHASYGLERVNREVCKWMRGEKGEDGNAAAPPFLAMGDSNSIMWNRLYSRERFPSPYEKFHTCNTLAQTLAKVNARRLVVGHTPQLEGANCECEQQIWRVDVGMSGGVLDAAAEILEISVSGEDTLCRVVSASSASRVAAKGF